MYDEQVRTKTAKNYQTQRRINLGMNSIRLVYYCANWNDIEVIKIFNEERKCCNHRCPDSVYFHTVLLFIYLGVIETLICHKEISLIGSTSFGFAQNTIHDFQSIGLNSWWHCLRQMPQNHIHWKSLPQS